MFASEVVLPTTLPLPPGSQLRITATAIEVRDRGIQATAPFEVEGFDNELIIETADPVTRARIGGVDVEILDRFRTLVARGQTGSDGAARFVGLSPSSGYSATVQADGREIFRSARLLYTRNGNSHGLRRVARSPPRTVLHRRPDLCGRQRDRAHRDRYRLRTARGRACRA